jgi:uncharacterized protein YgfB (UPF0149 family)
MVERTKIMRNKHAIITFLVLALISFETSLNLANAQNYPPGLGRGPQSGRGPLGQIPGRPIPGSGQGMESGQGPGSGSGQGRKHLNPADPRFNPTDPKAVEGRVQGQTKQNSVPPAAQKNQLKTAKANKDPKEETDQKSKKTGKIQNISKLAQAQIDRSQNASDRLSQIIDRIKAQEAALALTDTKELDELLVKATQLKSAVDKDLADVKAKASELSSDLNDTTVLSLTATALSKQVKIFMTSVKVLKKDLIDLHKTLTDAVKELREYAEKAEKASNDNDSTSSSTPVNENPVDGQQETQ